MRPGRHGSMPSSELESILTRNGNFLSVIRAGSGDGNAGLYNAVTGEYLGGIGGGSIPEYSRMTKLDYGCACNPTGLCRTGLHGILLVRGWRNILYELVYKRVVSKTKEIRRILGSSTVNMLEYQGSNGAPMFDPHQTDHYASL